MRGASCVLEIWTNGKRMASGPFSCTATVRMTGKGGPAWDDATLMPDGAVGASASGGRATLLAPAFAAGQA
jgi:hypothetical protein